MIDYASVITIASNTKVICDLEFFQNDALRIIFKKSLLDKVSIETLRDWADIVSVENRHENPMTDFQNEMALIKYNPLIEIEKLFLGYKEFKIRNLIREEFACDLDGSVNLGNRELIRRMNLDLLSKEKHPTILCGANEFIKDFIIDFGGLAPFRTALH